MEAGKRTWVIVLVVLVAVVAIYRWGVSDVTRKSAPPVPAAVASLPARSGTASLPHASTPKGFTRAQMTLFFAAATRAERIADPLQRCLAYPDPPGSHWTRAAVVAYCQYRYQPIVTLTQVRKLIEQGKSAQLDRLLGETLQAQLTQPQARGRLDRTFYADFSDGSLDLRYLLDAWKRASPDSAFAYAASGYAYVQMAFDARGANYISKTPQDNLESMHRLLIQADTDLQQARKLDPRITPIYDAMIRAGAYELGAAYLGRAVREGLKQDPANFSIYGTYLWAAQPQWYGSIAAMQQVVDESLKQADRNPMLLLDKPVVAAYLANVNACCGRPVHVDDFRAVLDDAAAIDLLSEAGQTAADYRQPAMATVYLSETVRFNAGDFSDRLRLAQLIAGAHQPPLLMIHARRLVAAAPDDPTALGLRGFASLQLGDVPHAKADLAAALAKSPNDPSLLSQLGSIYVHFTHEWDKGWVLADRLIQQFPQYPGGWQLRASIQLHQPRAGLDDTLHYYILHFGSDPREKGVVREMRRILQAEAKGGKDPLKPFRG